MSRAKYTEEERDAILINFIDKTKTIIESQGLEQVTTRRLAELTGYNSAKLYFYFRNLDELVTMSLLSNLEDYCCALASDGARMTDAYETLIHTWRLFCRFAFREPKAYYHIFFGRHETPIEDIIHEYYRLFPQQLEKLSGGVHDMLLQGSLTKRNLKVLEPLAEKGLLARDNLALVNDLMVLYFKELMERCRENPPEYSVQCAMTEDFINAAEFLLRN